MLKLSRTFTFQTYLWITMPLFIFLSLALSFMEQTAVPLRSLLITPWFIYIGLILAIISIAGSAFKKTQGIIWYDIFASGTLIAWYAYWKPLFNNDSPIFFFYPLYFALLTALISLFIMGQQHKIDNVSLSFMKTLSRKRIIQPAVIMLCILGSLALQQHFMLYPTLMTLLIIRFVLSSCLEGRNHRYKKVKKQL